MSGGDISPTSSMTLRINGQEARLAAGTTLVLCLTGRGLDPGTVVVERNGHIVPAEKFAQTRLEEGDTLEILHFVGGG